jgi:ABC-2 type transport system permease protein
MNQAFALIRWELWQRRWSLLWWSLGVAGLVGLDMLLYISIRGEAAQFNQLMQHLSPTVRSLTAGSNVDFLSPVGFLSARVYYLLLPLLLTIFTMNLGSKLVGKEEQDGTLELLLARPVSRTTLLLSKLGAGVLAVSLLGFVALLTAIICLHPSGLTGISYKGVAMATLAAVLLSSLFGMIAFTFTALGRPARSAATGIAALFAFASYIISSLESSVHWLRWPAKLLPYHHFRPSVILAGASSQKWEMLGFLVVIGALAVVSWIGFRRRDIG